MSKIIMFGHNGSRNHGCEAIVKSTYKIIQDNYEEVSLISSNVEEDESFLKNYDIRILSDQGNPPRDISYLKAYLKLKISKDFTDLDRLHFKAPFQKCKDNDGLALSIGGDNYCYNDHKRYIMKHQLAMECGFKTVLWGCSIDEKWIKKKEINQDLKQFDLVYTRESITYEAMKANGIEKVVQIPDPAFLLDQDETMDVLPPQNTIGLNLSPYVLQNELQFQNIISFIKIILSESDYSLALIPHVCWENVSDMNILKQIKSNFKEEQRVILLNEYDCCKIKTYIAHLRFLITARTHASVAAYSTYIPTLVIGYSVKSRGIARDIFGSEENYVLDYEELNIPDKLYHAFKWIEKNESNIKKHLNKVMPEYCEQVWRIQGYLQKL